MANFEFNPIADVVTLRILCPKYGEEFLTEGLGIPSPDGLRRLIMTVYKLKITNNNASIAGSALTSRYIMVFMAEMEKLMR